MNIENNIIFCITTINYKQMLMTIIKFRNNKKKIYVYYI